MTTKWEISDRVENRIKDKPTALGSAIIVEYVEDAANDIQNFTSLSIDLTDIGSSFHPAITDMAHLYALQYMSNVGVSYNLGRTKIDKRTELDGLNKQMVILEARVSRHLNMLGKRVKQGILNISDTQL